MSPFLFWNDLQIADALLVDLHEAYSVYNTDQGRGWQEYQQLSKWIPESVHKSGYGWQTKGDLCNVIPRSRAREHLT